MRGAYVKALGEAVIPGGFNHKAWSELHDHCDHVSVSQGNHDDRRTIALDDDSPETGTEGRDQRPQSRDSCQGYFVASRERAPPQDRTIDNTNLVCEADEKPICVPAVRRKVYEYKCRWGSIVACEQIPYKGYANQNRVPRRQSASMAGTDQAIHNWACGRTRSNGCAVDWDYICHLTKSMGHPNRLETYPAFFHRCKVLNCARRWCGIARIRGTPYQPAIGRLAAVIR
jgi:hypothetical protein